MNKLIRTFILGIILSMVFMTGCSKIVTSEQLNNLKELKIENLKSAKIQLATTGAKQSKNYTFDLNNSEQSKILKNVIYSLKTAKVQGYADEKFTNKGGTPTFLILELKDGSVIKIKSAIGGKVTKLSNGSTETSQFDIPNEVTISMDSNIKPFRILSPEIKNLINSGYKDIFK